MQASCRVLFVVMTLVMLADVSYSVPAPTEKPYPYYALRGQSNFLLHMNDGSKQGGTWLRPSAIVGKGKAVLDYGPTSSSP